MRNTLGERCIRWLVLSEEECGISINEAREKEYEYWLYKLEMMIESERKKRMELNKIFNVLVVELERLREREKKYSRRN